MQPPLLPIGIGLCAIASLWLIGAVDEQHRRIATNLLERLPSMAKEPVPDREVPTRPGSPD